MINPGKNGMRFCPFLGREWLFLGLLGVHGIYPRRSSLWLLITALDRCTNSLCIPWTVGEYSGCFLVFNGPESSKNALMSACRGFSTASFFTAFVYLVK